MIRPTLTTTVVAGGLALLAGVALAAVLVLTSVLGIRRTVEEQTAAAAALSHQSGAFNTEMFRAIAEFHSYARTGDPADRDDALHELRDARVLAEQLRQQISPGDPEQAALHRQRLAALELVERNSQALIQAVVANDPPGVAQALDQLTVSETDVEAMAGRAGQAAERALAGAAAASAAVIQRALWGVGGLFALIVLALLGALLFAQRAVVQPITLLAAAAGAVAAGQRELRLAVTNRDEIGRLQRAFNQMLDALQQADAAVAERTQELAQARDQALGAGRHAAAQNAYLAALHDTTLDLLNHHAAQELFQTIVERAAAILDAPYCELMLREGDLLVVLATSPNQAALRGERVGRQEAALSWQAFDTRQPAVLEDYAAWPQHREVYDPMALHAVADFPILVGQECRGVLALGRDLPDRPFTADAIAQGMQFARLCALVLEQARLYDLALAEIAERRQAELALQRLADELQAQNEDLDAFARTVAHDLKIPLTSVIGYSQLLLNHRDTLEPAQVQEFLEIIGATGRKMSAIVNDLLLLARVRTLESVPLTDVPMARVVADVAERLRPLIAEAQATLVTPARWPRSVGYAPWVEEVWANYLSNAIKYGGRPPRIVLGADEPQDGLVRFWVEDNGPGLSEQQRAQIFTPFTRFHTDQAAGHGLGLSIVERIVSKLGGSVGVESAPGQGCRFCFTLPAEHPALLDERTV